MDFIRELPKSYCITVILVLVDRLSKAAHFMALKHPFTVVEVAQVFFDNVVKLHGFPQTTLIDRDPSFGLNYSNYSKLFISLANHPQTNSQRY